MLTDEQLNPMMAGAPLLVSEYKKIREKLKMAAGMLAASAGALGAARLEIGSLREGIQKDIERLSAERDDWKRKYEEVNDACLALHQHGSMR